MVRPAPDAARTLAAEVILVLLIMVAATSGAVSGGAPRNVVVVQNSLSTISSDITSYYANARGIPLENICRIRCSTSELISKIECENSIIAPIRQFLQKSSIADHIDYIVLTKGVPLAADYGYSSGPLSIASILTCVSEPTITEYIENPYGPLAWDPVEIAFSHQLDLGGYHLYLVTRLDGYSPDDIYAMIDRSTALSSGGPIVLDQKALGGNPPGSSVMLNQRLADANTILIARNIPTIFDSTSNFISNEERLMGYFGWGSNDPSYTKQAYNSNLFSPGSIADTYVSSSGRTFDTTTAGASLIADLITQGACGVAGFVSEPYTAYATYPDILFDRYTKGYNLAESFHAAIPMLFWKSVVVGDPLMAPYAIAPCISIQFPEDPLKGAATINAAASSPRGISLVEFYFDGALIGARTQSPYSVQVDTTKYPVGTHKVEVRAVDGSPVATEASASTYVNVENPISTLRVIADAFPSPDGQGVLATAKVVVAGTAEMGGSEYYIEEQNRTSGIRIASNVPVQEGDVVTVTGNIYTQSGERFVEASAVTIDQKLPSPIKPVGIAMKKLGGGSANANTPGVSGMSGLRNMGLLVVVWGKVTYSGAAGENFFYLDDGSKLKDGSGRIGLKIWSRDLIKPTIGARIRVTGVCCCEDLGGRIVPTVKLRRQQDIVELVL